MSKLTVGSLFAGIGGIELGLERTGGFETVWQVEKDDYCRRVLAKHWPNVTRYEDVRKVGENELNGVDLICGGFPCQDISVAGKPDRDGIQGERSGLWNEFARIVREIRPRYVLVENVAALRYRRGGLGVVLRDLATGGYDAEWITLRASAFKFPHQRERVFVIAYPEGSRREAFFSNGLRAVQTAREGFTPRTFGKAWLDGSPKPTLRGENHGLPRRVDRLRVLGNAVVPKMAEFIGQKIITGDNND